MKIFQINLTSGHGSTGRIVKDLASVISSNNGEVFVGYGFFQDNSLNSYKTVKSKSVLGVKLSLMRTRVTGYHGYTNRHKTEILTEKIREFEPDVIHLHNIHGGFINIETLFNFLSKYKKPIIWTLHDCWTFTGHCAYFSYIGCEKWKTGCEKCPQLKSYPKSYFFDRSKYQWNSRKDLFTNEGLDITLVTPSNWLSSIVKESYMSKYPVHVINNGIDLDTFKPIRPNNYVKNPIFDNKKIVLAVASSWSERKGLRFINEVAELLSNDYQLIVVGVTTKQKNELNPKIYGIERTNNVSELVEYYNIANVFINPTLEDNFPTTNIEALACGTPVISFNTGGSIEAIDNSTGIILKENNEVELFNAIVKVCENDKNHYREKCRERAIALYNKNDRYQEYFDLYKTLIKNSDQ